MRMIKEDYVSYKTAKLLKEKGFNVECNMAYFNGTLVDYTMFGFCLGGDLFDCPTLQMAMKWLREVHKLYCDIRVGDGDFVIDIISLKDGEFGCEVAEPESCVYPTYEEACEAGIKYVLENLV